MEAAGIPTDIIIYAVIAAVLVVWLARVLGTKNGSERERPNPFAQNPAGTPVQQDGVNNVALPLPQKPAALKNVTPGIEAGLVQISLADRSFEPTRFIENAKEAFAIVVAAFADGDKATLQDLLAKDVYASFETAIEAREKAGKKVSAEVQSIRDASITEARLSGTKAIIAIRFKADETYVETDSTGKIIAGNPDKIVSMTDVWVFARETKSNDPRWLVIETRDDVKEDDGRKLPEAGIAA